MSALRATSMVRQDWSVHRATRLLLTAGLVGPTLFIIVFLIEDFTRPGYSPWRDMVSSLALSNQGWEQIANFFVCGVCVLAFAIGLRQIVRTGIGHVWGPLLIGIFGLSLIVAGSFSTDPALGYPPGAPNVQTWHGTIHGLNAPIAFGSLTAATFVFARRFLTSPGSRAWGLYSLFTGILLLVSIVGSLTVAQLDKTGVMTNAPGGLLERVTIIAGWVWVALLALHIPPPRPSPARGEEDS